MSSQSIHERATSIISRVMDLPREEALLVINRECDNNDDLRKAVMDLYNSITPAANPENASGDSKTTIKRINQVDKGTSFVLREWQGKVIENKQIRLAILTISLLLLLALGLSIRMQVRRMLINDTVRHLEDQLYSQYIRMHEWITAGKSNIQALASDPVVIEIAKECDSLQLTDPSFSQLRQYEKEGIFYKQFKGAPSFTRVTSGIISKEGARILTGLYRRDYVVDSLAGIRLGKDLYDAYLEGRNKTVFVKPLSEEETIHGMPDTTNRWIICVFFAPIKDREGKLLGVLFTTHLANNEFSDILSSIHFGKRGETYAFDKQGRMLSSSRFLTDLRKMDFFKLAENDESIYNVILKNPGVDLSKGLVPKKTGMPLHFVKPVQDLLCQLETAEPSDTLLYGSSNRAYRNYMGKLVISRWMWWRKYEFGIITEVQLSEALRTLKYFDYAFLLLYVLILGLSYLLFRSNVKIFRAGKKIKDIQQLGHYKLKKKIGEGGFGEVYRAEHAFLKTPVAIKLLKKQFNGTDMLDRFEKEVKVTSSLMHPNTIRVFDFGTTREGQFYYVMEYLNGLTLDKLVQKQNNLPLNRGIHILLSTCLSLQEAHNSGLIHRDIKPGNIMLCNQGGECDTVKVLDFGLVKSVNTDKSDQTQLNRIGGTPMFMAPERLRDPYNTDQRVDLYSIGALGVYMFSGKYLLELVSQKMLSGEPTIQSDFKSQLINRDDIPEELNNLLLKCLSFEIEKRPERIEEVIDQLDKLSFKYRWTRKDALKWWQEYDVYG
jgi:tRNA A-37 threonylcarbamoyl transferase component Bud32